MVKKGSSSAGKNAFGDYKFINVSLGKDDKAWLDKNANFERFPLTGISYLVAQGIKVSFSEDSKNHSAVCSLTETRDGHPYQRYILTGRGASTADAWFAVCYKHFTMAGEDWSKVIDDSESSGNRFG